MGRIQASRPPVNSELSRPMPVPVRRGAQHAAANGEGEHRAGDAAAAPVEPDQAGARHGEPLGLLGRRR
jgi:hypothetical protein